MEPWPLKLRGGRTFAVERLANGEYNMLLIDDVAAGLPMKSEEIRRIFTSGRHTSLSLCEPFRQQLVEESADVPAPGSARPPAPVESPGTEKVLQTLIAAREREIELKHERDREAERARRPSVKAGRRASDTAAAAAARQHRSSTVSPPPNSPRPSLGGDEKAPSAIIGTGYGSSHCWLQGETAQVGADSSRKQTQYCCADCGELFVHRYAQTPDIFQAMREAGVKDGCPKGLALTVQQVNDAGIPTDGLGDLSYAR